MSRLAITQVKSGIGAPRPIRRTLDALGLRHQRTVVKPDNAAIRGMVFRVRHLVEVSAAEGTGKEIGKPRTRARTTKTARSRAKTKTQRSKSS